MYYIVICVGNSFPYYPRLEGTLRNMVPAATRLNTISFAVKYNNCKVCRGVVSETNCEHGSSSPEKITQVA